MCCSALSKYVAYRACGCKVIRSAAGTWNLETFLYVLVAGPAERNINSRIRSRFFQKPSNYILVLGCRSNLKKSCFFFIGPVGYGSVDAA